MVCASILRGRCRLPWDSVESSYPHTCCTRLSAKAEASLSVAARNLLL
uniref:Uncharacterized protein n=1 Tax=Anguilla anguilla TaxID=7936 RepID=A0A0E9XIW9_ANGAN